MIYALSVFYPNFLMKVNTLFDSVTNSFHPKKRFLNVQNGLYLAICLIMFIIFNFLRGRNLVSYFQQIDKANFPLYSCFDDVCDKPVDINVFKLKPIYTSVHRITCIIYTIIMINVSLKWQFM